MNNARPLRPTPGPTAHIFHNARLAISDAMYAGDPRTGARMLYEAADQLMRYDRLWTDVRPALGVRPCSTATQPPTPSGQREEAA